MDRGKRVMHPEADFDLNKEPWENEEECEKAKKKARICELEAELDHVLVTTKTLKQCNEGLKKKLIDYIEENKMPINIMEVDENKDQNLLWESIVVLKELVTMDQKNSSSQTVSSDDKKK